jgi:immune inhibitor A
MKNQGHLLRNFERIRQAALQSEDGLRCAVAPHPDLREKMRVELAAVRGAGGGVLGAFARSAEPRRPGLNDGMIIPPEQFPLGTPLSVIRSAAAERAPLRGVVRVIVVLVDFSDKPMTKTQAHFRELFFSTGVIATKSVREYYTEVTHGLIDIQGDVAGPFRLPLTLAEYAHGGSGLGNVLPNAQTMARDAVIAADPAIDFTPYDNDGNGFVDAFIVIHAGGGGEETGNPGDIWSHKWVIDGGAKTVDNTKIFGYLTVPEDCRIGVCCHELGHLLYGFPDLYDTDQTSEGIGNWCLMAAGSWGGGGDTPVHPCAWCKVNQGWVSVDNRTTNGPLSIPDVKDSNTVYRLWKDGTAGSEYFLMENRQKNRFDASLPESGLLLWHIDESVPDNTNEAHYKVALMQADGQRDLELDHNRGDGGDPYPGSSANTNFNNGSNPNSKSYSGVSTCVSVTGISSAAPVMTANVAVHCKSIEKNRFKEFKEIRDKHLEKSRFKESHDKHLEKPVTDKSSALDKGFADKPTDVKVTDGKFAEGKITDGGKLTEGGGGLPGGQPQSTETAIAQLESRVAALEAALGQLSGGVAPQPFIGTELRPDLTQSALAAEPDYAHLQEQMQQGSPEAKRLYDMKWKEQ